LATIGLKLRGRTFNLRIDGDKYEISEGDQFMRSTIGETIAFSISDGVLRLVD
jgi:hypothetical protein